MTAITAARARVASGSPRGKIAALLMAIVAVFVLSACHYVGSGTVTSVNGTSKATFTFDLKCSTSGVSSGVLTYADNAVGVSLHGVAGPVSMANACNAYYPFETITGTYTPLKPGAGGTFTVSAIPGGTSQTEWGHFCITLSGGVYDGYSNSGTVYKGNIVLAGS